VHSIGRVYDDAEGVFGVWRLGMFGIVLCRLNLHHAWRVESTEDGQRFRRCLRCGKDDSRGGPGPGDWAAPLGG